MLSENLKELPVAAALESYDSSAVHDGSVQVGQLTVYIDPAKIVDVCRHLKQNLRFNRLSGITGLDWHPREPRFEVVYFLHSLERNERVRLKCRVSGDNPEIDSVTSVWGSANWYEREVFDLFGVRFRNHPNLTRIMLPEGWDGHPLRKDYPVHGHKYDYPTE